MNGNIESSSSHKKNCTGICGRSFGYLHILAASANRHSRRFFSLVNDCWCVRRAWSAAKKREADRKPCDKMLVANTEPYAALAQSMHPISFSDRWSSSSRTPLDLHKCSLFALFSFVYLSLRNSSPVINLPFDMDFFLPVESTRLMSRSDSNKNFNRLETLTRNGN